MSAVDMVIILTELKLNLHEKRVSNFVPHQAKRILEKLEKNEEVDARFFLNGTRCFTRNVNHSWMFIEIPSKV